MFLTSAWRFLSRLSVLMTRFRASMTSLRRAASSPSEALSTGGGAAEIRAVLVSSLIVIMLRSTLGKGKSIPRGEFSCTFFGRPGAGSSRADVAPGACPHGPAALLRPLRLAFLVGLEEVEHQPQRKEVAAGVDRLPALRVHLGAGEQVAILDHQRDRTAELHAQPERKVGGGGVGLVVEAGARGGVEHVADAAAAVEGERLAAHEHRVEGEEDGDAPDLEILA